MASSILNIVLPLATFLALILAAILIGRFVSARLLGFLKDKSMAIWLVALAMVLVWLAIAGFEATNIWEYYAAIWYPSEKSRPMAGGGGPDPYLLFLAILRFALTTFVRLPLLIALGGAAPYVLVVLLRKWAPSHEQVSPPIFHSAQWEKAILIGMILSGGAMAAFLVRWMGNHL